jgi:cytochrome c oxidase assembly factor CtaG/putative copper export protein
VDSALLRVARYAVLAVAAAALALIAALIFGGAVTETVIPGLADAGALTRWGLPVSRLSMDLLSALTVGALLAAVVLLPLDTSRNRAGLSKSSLGYLRGTSWLATAWALAAAATLIFTVSDVLGEPAGKVVMDSQLSGYIGDLPQGTALMLVVLLAMVVALLARTTTEPGGALGLLALAMIALLPPPLTGHSASAANHSLAMTGLALHVAAIAPWVGGLALLTAHALAGRPRLDVMSARFSRMALWCYVIVGLSGFANLLSRVPDPLELLTTDYGRLALAKIIAFALLGSFGYWHRERTVPALADDRPGKGRAFARLATVEVAVMAATVGLAVALSRTAPPSRAEQEPVTVLLGFPMPPEITLGRVVTLWQLDFFFAVLAVALGGVYLAAVVRLRRRGDAWSAGRSAAWLGGLLVIVLVTQSGLARYAPVLFSMHMVQHMALSMLAPIFLVLGAPVTLALRALRPARIRGDRGPREWLTAALHSKPAAVIAHPLVATAIFVVSTFALYFTPLFEIAMRNPLGHIAMAAHFLLSGTLFFWVLIGVDPAPRQVPYVGKLLVLFATMPFHAFFGIALMNLSAPIAEEWYRSVRPPWLSGEILDDQHAGGAIAWGFGEIPTFIVLIALVFQWFLHDQRTARRKDRQSDRAVARDGGDELAEYNARLAALAERDEDAKK